MLHIIQNDPEVPPGNIIDSITAPYRIHHPYCGELLPLCEQISALIVLGGAMGANDDRNHPFLTDLKTLIRQVVAAGIPYLGICLGGQLLAAALGATVVSHRWEEIGFSAVQLNTAAKDDTLFDGIPESLTTFQWHHDSFDIPAESVLLASSAACPNQAFRVGASAWGLQFHPEATEAIIRSWSAWDRSTRDKADELVAELCRVSDSYTSASDRLMKNFLKKI